MIRDSTPLLFPSADGPGLPADGEGPAERLTEPFAGRPWAIAPALVAGLCAAGALPFALHDGLGLPSAWAAALTLAAAAPAGLMLGRRLSRPLRALSARAEQLSVRYTGRAVRGSRNDMRNLMASFDAMTQALLLQLERLKALHLEEMQSSLELQRRYALMRVLRNVATAALECEHFEQVLERAVEELGGYLDWPIGRVLIAGDPADGRDPPQRSTWFVAEGDRYTAFVAASEAEGAEFSANGPIGLAGATGMPHWVTDLAVLRHWQRGETARQCGLKSGFVIPIAGDGSSHAFLEFFSDHRVEASAEMIELIEQIHAELWQAGQWRRERAKLAARSRAPAAPATLHMTGAAQR